MAIGEFNQSFPLTVVVGRYLDGIVASKDTVLEDINRPTDQIRLFKLT